MDHGFSLNVLCLLDKGCSGGGSTSKSASCRAGEPEPVGAGRSRVFLAPWSRSCLKKKTRSRSRLEKKSGAGAAKKIAGSSALREDKKNKENVL